mmetsp:Transcript_11836/g.15414  ORF Transcript_11836/g.15414 Transcript_11836/m.15414 type:complete len:594 (+) Transcript_11836:233-2014(+)|eukprot:CAMPEP_0204864008 /NCGR_PEP_ID=MMETSP1348-20121228/3749_1 /ASSEMBLY_ACC=CAM_ASM_000700 /TAXON_ID=215587 /ORGANISM="Aplanochytrium stocchinoi, Strain GSBS06" /LENGTH=593 /DNA_ID=CAMNT_0052014523 /DNA_START=221 /DNA_END=2002 /DNA_ORIENTATION=+
MEALKALAGQQGCSADGTAAARNPLSQFVGKMEGGQARGPSMGGARGQMRGNEMDAGMAAGMGMQAGPQGPRMMNTPQMVREFQQMQGGGSMGPVIAGPMGPRGPMGRGPQMGGEQWANQFQNMNLGGGPQFAPNPQMQMAFRESFGVNGPRPMGQRWSRQLAARTPAPSQMNQAWKQNAAQQHNAQNWAEQMAAPKEVPNAEAWAKEATQADPTLQEQNMQAAWDDSAEKVWNDIAKNANPELANAWDNPKDVQSIFEKAYQDELDGKPVDFEQVFKDAFGEQNNMFNNAWGDAMNSTPVSQQPYEMQTDNPYKDNPDAFEIGMEHFKKGELKQAVLAFESVIEEDVTHAEAWRMLGVTHQESDQDRQAIQCLEQAVEQDPYNLDALLGLGVSYVNELDQSRALKNLKAWVNNNPKFQGVQVEQDIYGDGSTDLMHDVMMLMTKVEEFAPNDPHVQQVLGVLFNVSRDYERAVKAFRSALNHRPDDYSLWNKLGATLANSNHSDEALPIYTRALELKPRYARGWLNFGISHSNLGDYKKAIRAYLRALDLNPEATHIWNYLRICLTCLEGYSHLIPEVEAKNLDAFRAAFDF